MKQLQVSGKSLKLLQRALINRHLMRVFGAVYLLCGKAANREHIFLPIYFKKALLRVK